MRVQNPRALVPLRIPSLWKVVFNNFREIDPDSMNLTRDDWRSLDEDLLLLEVTPQEGSKWPRLAVGLGWYPAGSPDGCYRLTFGHDGCDEEVALYSTRRYLKMIAMIEEWLRIISKSDSLTQATPLLRAAASAQRAAEKDGA